MVSRTAYKGRTLSWTRELTASRATLLACSLSLPPLVQKQFCRKSRPKSPKRTVFRPNHEIQCYQFSAPERERGCGEIENISNTMRYVLCLPPAHGTRSFIDNSADGWWRKAPDFTCRVLCVLWSVCVCLLLPSWRVRGGQREVGEALVFNILLPVIVTVSSGYCGSEEGGGAWNVSTRREPRQFPALLPNFKC